MVRDIYQRCAVCGRRPSEPCCDRCHRAHDYRWEHPDWSVGGSGNRVIPAQDPHYWFPAGVTP